MYRPERLLKSFNTNFFGPVNLTRAMLPHMREKNSGVIAFVGSQVGVTDNLATMTVFILTLGLGWLER